MAEEKNKYRIFYSTGGSETLTDCTEAEAIATAKRRAKEYQGKSEITGFVQIGNGAQIDWKK